MGLGLRTKKNMRRQHETLDYELLKNPSPPKKNKKQTQILPYKGNIGIDIFVFGLFSPIAVDGTLKP